MMARNCPGMTVPSTLSMMIFSCFKAPSGLQRPVGGRALMTMSVQVIYMSCLADLRISVSPPSLISGLVFILVNK